jgi:hypothetical protein
MPHNPTTEILHAIKIGFLGGRGGRAFPIKKDESLRVIREAFIYWGYECSSWFTLANTNEGVVIFLLPN